MSPERFTPSAEDAHRALIDHAVDRALRAREKYGPLNASNLETVLEDREVVRFPTRLVFDDSILLPGEFAHAQETGETPADGYVLAIHPYFRDRPQDIPLLAAYHLVTVNYGDVATSDAAEAFGATLVGLDVETYYRRLCELADELALHQQGGAG